MKLFKYLSSDGRERVGVLQDDNLIALRFENGQVTSLFGLLETRDIRTTIDQLRDDTAVDELSRVTLLPPIDQQEVWAAGVTYQRSQTARMEESEAAASCYDRVYHSARPELFFKATPHRVVGPEAAVRIRRDSRWNVPEPELTLALNSQMRLVGFTIGNDMSSRDIEGENPLYLPQAKLYSDCCSLGPCITLADDMPPRDEIGIRLRVLRRGESVYEGQTDVGQMARSFEDLIQWLSRDNRYPHGVFLLTGTGIVPDPSFTLHPGDQVEINIDGIGRLANTVVQD
jgi:2-dehydro-3-deoxy-D-arabinonate dehydratase